MRAHDMAAFVLATGVQPSEYPNLTRLEKDAFIDIVKKARRKG